MSRSTNSSETLSTYCREQLQTFDDGLAVMMSALLIMLDSPGIKDHKDIYPQNISNLFHSDTSSGQGYSLSSMHG